MSKDFVMRCLIVGVSAALLVGVSAAAYVSGSAERAWEGVVDSTARRMQEERRELFAERNERNYRCAELVDSFTQNEPVTVVRFEEGGAVVQNHAGAEMFARFDEDAELQIGDSARMGPSPEGPLVRSYVE